MANRVLDSLSLINHVGLHVTREPPELDLLSRAHWEFRAILRYRLRLFARQTSLIESSDVGDHHCEREYEQKKPNEANCSLNSHG